MASQKSFVDLPPFPDDVPVAPIHTIPLSSLRAGDENAAKSLLAACQELGFFLLSLEGDSIGDELIQEIDRLFLLAQEIMALPIDVKQQYLHDAPRSFLG